MRMCAQAAAVGVGSTCADETRVFFDILTHDDHNSNYILARCANGSWSERVVRAGGYRSLAFGDKASYYLTRNGFTGSKRLVSRTRQVNALMFDIDCHGDNGAMVLPDLTAVMYDAFADGTLPQPSLFVFTGRGLHVYYVLDRATPYRVTGGGVNERGLKYLRDVEAGLADRIREVVAPIPGAEVDASVFDFARVARVPGSWNEKAGVACTLLSYSWDYHSLSGLAAYRSKKPAASRIAPAGQAGPRNRGRVLRFDRLMSARLRKVEELQAHRGFDCQGSRENMCFVYYNTATQIYGPDTALDMALAFNRRFRSPLPESDIAAIKRTVDNVTIEHGFHKGERGFYPLSAHNLCDKLNMSAEEAGEVRFFASKRVEDRLAAKAATRDKRQKRNAEIVRLYATKGLTQKEIVETLRSTELACCLRTVATVLSAANARRARKEDLRTAARRALESKPATAATREAQASEHAKSWPTGCSVVPSIPFRWPVGAFAAPARLPLSLFLPPQTRLWPNSSSSEGRATG